MIAPQTPVDPSPDSDLVYRTKAVAPIPVPPKATAQIGAIIQRRAQVDAELQQAGALVLAALGAPDGWVLRVEADGSMVAVGPALRQAQGPDEGPGPEDGQGQP